MIIKQAIKHRRMINLIELFKSTLHFRNNGMIRLNNYNMYEVWIEIIKE